MDELKELADMLNGAMATGIMSGLAEAQKKQQANIDRGFEQTATMIDLLRDIKQDLKALITEVRLFPKR